MSQSHPANRSRAASHRNVRTSRAALSALGLFLTAVLAVLLLSPQAFADDTELLRANSSNPFLFILLDNSRSMAASIDDQWLHAGADDPRSRLYIAKEVLYEELQSLSDVHYGLATFNQDEVRVHSKHYLYYVADTADNAAEIASMPSNLDGYPALEPSNEISYIQTDATTGADETIVDIDGDLLTLGRTFPFDLLGDQTPAGGTCATPLDLSTEREAINRYPKFGEDGDDTVTMWVEGKANSVYRIRWKRPALATWSLGDTTIDVTVNITEAPSCLASAIGLGTDYDLELRLWKPFLWVDDDNGADTGIGGGGGGGGCGADDAEEIAGGFWSLDPLDVDVVTQCVDKPFSGQGWEGNYDTGQPYTTNNSFESSLSTGTDYFDSYCNGAGATTTNCVNRKIATTYATSPDKREIDVGDMVPFHWDSNYHDTLLSRLNPLHPGGEDFGVAGYFQDSDYGTTDTLALVSAARKPILAAGNSPIGAAALDFRCWFVGEGSNKCNRSGSFTTTYDDGFLKLLEDNDTGLWACRRPFMIVITDLYGNCTSNSNVANIAGMFSETSESGLKNGVSTWLLNMGQGKCNGFTNAGKGETIDVASKSELRQVLREILGEIEETSRAFAAAAVPTVQADVEDKIYFTQFTPLQNLGLWPGEVLAFKKPLPTVQEVDIDGSIRLVPDRDEKVWDAGEAMMAQSPDPGSLTGPYYTKSGLKVGAQENERRAFYMVEPKLWNYFAPVESTRSTPDNSVSYSLNELRNDMWEGMGIVTPGPLVNETLVDIKADATLNGYLVSAHSALHYTMIEKQAVDKDGVFLRNFILGDIFHSNPQVMGNPTNSFYLSDPVSYPGYEEFASRHERRRKILFVGANDGMMHAFDAGRWEGTFEDGEFNNGTGKEIFGYVPRDALRSLRALSENREDHRWFVDGTAQIGDVLIDVTGDGVKEWRTVLIGGMRRGGTSLFALDVTQPDPVEEVTRDLGGTTVNVGYLPTENDVVPECWDQHVPLGNGITVPTDGNCDALPFGTPLWEVTDDNDDDGSGRSDLGQSWSAVEIGPIRVNNTLTGADPTAQPELRWVAIHGGGLDPDWATDSGKGNWLYITDIETGNIIYKRRLGANGSAAAPAAALDSDLDGVVDRVYVGTTYGQLWRIDMSTVPDLVEDASKCTKGAYSSDICIDETDTDWDPVLFFDTVTSEVDDDGNPVQQRRPFFFSPAVFYVGQLGGFGIAAGTGNRDDIWAAGPYGGNRFYVFADEVCKNSIADTSLCQLATDLPLYETDIVDVTGETECGSDVVTDVSQRDTGERGWFVELGSVPLTTTSDGGNQTTTFFDPSDELQVTPTLNIAGLTVFNTFVPETQRTRTNDGPECSRRGISRSYLYFTASGCNLDVQETGTLVSDVFLERKQTQNKSCEEDPSQSHCTSGAESEDPCSGNEDLNQRIRDDLFPSTCRFSEIFSYPLMVNQSNTGIKCLVELPMCIQQRNWKEF